MFCEHRLSLKSPVVEAEIEFHAPWTVLFGPSGSGKSSVLRGMCGVLADSEVRLERLEGGAWTRLDQRPTERRGLSYAPQGAAVFPHLSVRENVAFGMKVSPEPLKGSALVDEAMSLFRLRELAGRRPAELSGGERQRVALARAFATPGVKLMLLDEPFSGLGRGLRDELLPEMQESLLKREIQCVSVTHDVDEALLLGADVVRLAEGRVVAVGGAREVLVEERERLIRALG